MRKSFFVVGAVLAMALTGCVATVRGGTGPTTAGGPPPPPPPSHDHRGPRERILAGHVLDAATRQPLDRAAVEVASDATHGQTIATRTNPDGSFETDPLPPGEIRIKISREGYEPVRRTAVINRGVTEVTVELNPAH